MAKSFEEWRAAAEKVAQDFPKIIERALMRGVRVVRAEAVEKHLSGPKMPSGVGSTTRATLQPRSGDLRASIQTEVDARSSPISGKIFTNMVYAGIHENGGVVEPRVKKALAWKHGGQWVFAKRVTIPKRPFLGPSLEARRDEIVEIMTDTIVEAIRGRQ